MKMDSLKLYKKLKRWDGDYETACALIVYNSIYCHVENPTDEEYKVIFMYVYNAYMKSEETNLEGIAEGVAEKYGKKEITLDDLSKMSKWDILAMAKY